MPYCYAPAAFVGFVCRERAVKSKHLQTVSGASTLVYWTSTYAFDAILFAIVTVLFYAVMLSYGEGIAAAFLSPIEASVTTLLLTFLYGLAALPQVCCLFLSRLIFL